MTHLFFILDVKTGEFLCAGSDDGLIKCILMLTNDVNAELLDISQVARLAKSQGRCDVVLKDGTIQVRWCEII